MDGVGGSADEMGVQLMAQLRTVRKIPTLGREGQATTEYILLLSIVLLIFITIAQGITNGQLMGKLLSPINNDFRKAYQNGHPKASAPDDPGGSVKHPRDTQGNGGFRIFYSKGT
jgi:hypothetical protein